MIYLYAQTGKEFGLDALRRVASIYNNIENQNIGILVNDFRAQQAGLSFDLPLSVPIEDIGLIAGIVNEGDIILLDTSEDLEQFIKKFDNKFKQIIRISRDCNTTPIANEKVLSAYGEDKDFGYWQLARLKPKSKDSKKTILYYSDSDVDLYLHKNRDIFKDLDISLIWGEYFYVKYEDDYSSTFKSIYESEEFEELLEDGVKVITASIQIASELKVAGYEVLLIDKKKFTSCQKEMIDDLNIELLDIRDRDKIVSFINTNNECQNISYDNNIKKIFI